MTTFKNYTIIKSLGKGGQAEVYLAEDNRFQSKVAIKVLNADLALNSNISQRFIAEARNMFRLSHQNIIRVSDLIEEDGRKAFAMEYIEGNNLRDEVEKFGALSQEVILAWMPQILNAMSYCHAEGLVHRDIKPSNFMLTKKGQIKLLDFGIAKIIGGNSEYTQTGTSQMMGTPLYMSPEQILETRNVDLRSDIYSLGVVLWQFVTGKKPYDSETLSSFQIQSKIVNEPLPLSGSKFDQIIKKCTAKDSKERFQSCEEIQEALDGLFKNSKISLDSEQTIVSPRISDEKTTFILPSRLNDAPQTNGVMNNINIKKSYTTELTLLVLTIILFCLVAMSIIGIGK
jgi:serine/threonine protein kinase